MKKWTALLLTLVLCGSLAACGGNENAAAEDGTEPNETVETTTPAQDAGETAQDEAEQPGTDSSQADANQTISQTTQQSSTTGGDTSSAPAGTGGGASSAQTGTGSTATKPQTSAPAPTPDPAPEPAPTPEPAAPTASQASGYIGGSAAALESALGAPQSKSYSPSCMGAGEDGIWSYGSFTVYTYRENGVETVEAVQ
nr:hypothetical protein [uncultured Agathobaculum sp.]